MEHRIDCAGIHSPGEFHRILAEELAFPPWYGANLDALYDCLTACPGETHLILLNWDAAAPFARSFRRVFQDAAADNPKLTVSFR